MLQSYAEVFSRNIIALFPLPLQQAMLIGKHLSDLIDHIRYQRIRLLDSRAGFVHKLALDFTPACAKKFRLLMI